MCKDDLFCIGTLKEEDLNQIILNSSVGCGFFDLEMDLGTLPPFVLVSVLSANTLALGVRNSAYDEIANKDQVLVG
jgi:hypothetical protein